MGRKIAKSGKAKKRVISGKSGKQARSSRARKKSRSSPSARPGKRESAKKLDAARMGLTVTHRVLQRLEIDISDLSAEDAESAQDAHREPDIYVNDESFPGEMSWRVVESSVAPTPGKRKSLSLARTIDFTFACTSTRAVAAWAERNVALDDALLPSHVAGDFEGIFVGDQMLDYATDYRGPCA